MLLVVKVQHGLSKLETEGESVSADTKADEQFPKTRRKPNEGQGNRCDEVAL
jgi:hypothetical protein